ncbi:MAG: hypothetical protein M4579_007328 [Chaenotheca gracillima]|nr:MAG: hypothetical protein M4579_007328 [Chaenotheca gracillima]
MLPQHAADRVDLSAFKSILTRYGEVISSLSKPSSSGADSLEQLDQWRFDELPKEVAQRTIEHGQAWLEQTEVEDLIKWKLKHGKFRPRLTQLVASNPSSTTTSTTKDAFKTYTNDTTSSPLPAITKLSSLKGIGPASASLLLAVFDPLSVPFFSDECFRWLMFESATKGKGWDRPIKYDVKEYRILVERVGELRDRLRKESGEDVSAADVEKVAYVLGKEDGRGTVPASTGRSKKETSPKKDEKAGVSKESQSATAKKRKASPEPEKDIGDGDHVSQPRRSSRRRK